MLHSVFAAAKQLPEQIFNCPIGDIIDFEIETEKEFLFPIQEMIEIINLAHRRGKKIMVTSDIYLDAKTLKYFWGDSTKDVDISFHVSCEYKTGKYSGLFDTLLKKLKLKPASVLHIGDNYVSDVQTPSSRGIRTCFVPHGSSEFWSTFNSEVAPGHHLRDRVCIKNGDFGLTALRCKAMLYRSPAEMDKAGFFRYGAQILGPIFSPFIHWVRSSSLEAKAQVVLPLMREGYMIGGGKN